MAKLPFVDNSKQIWISLMQSCLLFIFLVEMIVT